MVVTVILGFRLTSDPNVSRDYPRFRVNNVCRAYII